MRAVRTSDDASTSRLDDAHLVTRRHPALDRVGGDGAREHDDVDLTVYASCATRLYAEAWWLHASRVASLSVAGPCRGMLRNMELAILLLVLVAIALVGPWSRWLPCHHRLDHQHHRRHPRQRSNRPRGLG